MATSGKWSVATRWTVVSGNKVNSGQGNKGTVVNGNKVDCGQRQQSGLCSGQQGVSGQ